MNYVLLGLSDCTRIPIGTRRARRPTRAGVGQGRTGTRIYAQRTFVHVTTSRGPPQLLRAAHILARKIAVSLSPCSNPLDEISLVPMPCTYKSSARRGIGRLVVPLNEASRAGIFVTPQIPVSRLSIIHATFSCATVNDASFWWPLENNEKFRENDIRQMDTDVRQLENDLLQRVR